MPAPACGTRHHLTRQDRHMFDVVLYQPEIPPNTGNIMRLCANAGTCLHLIEPLGFGLEDRQLRRAGLDYREWAEVRVHSSLGVYLRSRPEGRLYACSTRGRVSYTQPAYRAGMLSCSARRPAVCRKRSSKICRSRTGYSSPCTRTTEASICLTRWRSSFTRPGVRMASLEPGVFTDRVETRSCRHLEAV